MGHNNGKITGDYSKIFVFIPFTFIFEIFIIKIKVLSLRFILEIDGHYIY